MVERKVSLSKYTISNVFLFTEVRFSIKLRLVSKAFDTACLIGLTILAEYELVTQIDHSIYIINRDFNNTFL